VDTRCPDDEHDVYATFEHIQTTLAEQVFLRRPDGERGAVLRG
jgi:hypothetical protein